MSLYKKLKIYYKQEEKMWIKGLFTNDILIFSVISSLTAQLLKVIFYFAQKKKINWRLAISPGGNPSSHTAAVTTLTLLLGVRYGLGSPYFTISFVIASIIAVDALSLRREVGEHSKTMNEIFWGTAWGKKLREVIDIKIFEELIGHTGLEVAAGFIWGFIIAAIDIMLIK